MSRINSTPEEIPALEAIVAREADTLAIVEATLVAARTAWAIRLAAHGKAVDKLERARRTNGPRESGS